ncbi:flavin reductase family protein [Streptomyces sp. NBC_01304]|uniref:flavin reductase family protein n=1 Tax=Streptomyces sp. NBC_01304 TaxID=2903818 RepID=UPI002E0DCE70|nr:flavin reductase family protein [Streptomyces sp. NBC_01304]
MTATPDLSAPRLASPDLLRASFRRHAAGVAVITAQGLGPVGFTATSLSSAAAEPPLVSFGIGTGSSSWPVISQAEYVGVHILAEDQQDLAATFARSGADRFAEPTRWHQGPHGVPVLDGVLAWLVCRIVARVPAGDHRLVLAEVVVGDPDGTGPASGRPLLYHQGRFGSLRE